MQVTIASYQSDLAMDRTMFVMLTVGVAFISFGTSFVSYVVVESPLARLQNLMLAARR